jgi:hypothetical protein
LQVEQGGRGHITQLAGLCVREAGLSEEAVHHIVRRLWRVPDQYSAALLDDLVHQAACPRHNRQHRRADGPGRLPEHSHIVWIATETTDLVPHPLQGRNLVEDALVAGAVELVTTDPLAAQEAKQAKPVIERNHHHITPRGQPRAVEEWARTVAEQKSPAVQPDQHWPSRVVCRRGPDVEIEAVFAHLGEGQTRLVDRVGPLHGRRAIGAGLADPIPGNRFVRRAKAEGADGRLGIGNATEDEYPLLGYATQPAGTGMNDRCHNASLQDGDKVSLLPKVGL